MICMLDKKTLDLSNKAVENRNRVVLNSLIQHTIRIYLRSFNVTDILVKRLGTVMSFGQCGGVTCTVATPRSI